MNKQIDEPLPLPVLSEAEAEKILGNEQLRLKCEKLGIDLGLLVENLQASPDMRMRRHSNALRMALAFRAAGERARSNE